LKIVLAGPDGGGGASIRDMRKAALAAVLAALASASPAASTVSSGLRGVVKTPSPVCFQDTTCDNPAPGVTLTFSQAGKIVKRVKSGDAGQYLVRLGAGVYSVTSTSARGERVRPGSVRVLRGMVRRVDFLVDTGVRAP
jgi:hypothetical protein